VAAMRQALECCRATLGAVADGMRRGAADPDATPAAVDVAREQAGRALAQGGGTEVLARLLTTRHALMNARDELYSQATILERGSDLPARQSGVLMINAAPALRKAAEAAGRALEADREEAHRLLAELTRLRLKEAEHGGSARG
jgi:hypothetical protein